MGDDFELGITLVDKVSASADKMATAIGKVRQQTQKTQAAFDGLLFGQAFAKIGKAADANARQQKKHADAFGAMWAKIGAAAEKERQRVEKAKFDPQRYVAEYRAAQRLRDQKRKLLEDAGLKSKEGGIFGWASPWGSSRVWSNVIGNVIGSGIVSAADFLLSAAGKAADLFVEGVHKAFDESAKQQVLRVGESLSLGKDAGAFRSDVGRFSKLTGFDDDVIRGMLLKQRRAGFNQQASRTAFAAATDIAAGEGQGGNLGRVNELLEAFTNIKLKGGVREKMLPGLGVDVKEFYTDLASQLGLGKGKAGIDAAKKKAEEGSIDPQLLLNTIFRGVERKQGGELGTGAIAYSRTFESRLAKAKNLPNEYLKNLSESAGFQRASDMLASLLEKLDPDSPTGQRIMASIDHMFQKITDFIGDPAEAVDKIATGIEQMIGLLDQVIPSLKMMGDLLLSAAEAAAAGARQIRLMNAYAHFDKDEIARIHEEDEERIKEKKAQAARPYVTAQAQGLVAGTFVNALGRNGFDPFAAAAATFPVAQAAKKASDKVLQVHAPVEINLNAPVTDAGHTAQSAAVEVHRHVTTAIERAAQQSGG